MPANEPGQPTQRTSAIRCDMAVPSSALAIGAHPDDIEFGCGATLAKWAAAGCRVHHLICTDGSKGTWDATADPAALAATRQAEQIDAARRLSGTNAGDVVFLGYVDGELESDLSARAEVARTIRRLRPQVVLGHDPWKRYRIHPDHRHAGLLACEGIVAARDPHFFTDQFALDPTLSPHRPDALLLWEADAVDHVEQVDEFIDRKIDALRAHASQFESTMHAADAEQLAAFDRRIRQRLAELGAQFGTGPAEAFKRIDDL